MKNSIDVATAALFLAVTVGLAAAFWLAPDKTFSEDENRVLEPLPTPSVRSWLEGTLPLRLSDYYTDQIPLRSELVGLASTAQIVTGRGEANGVLWDGGDRLAVRRFDAYLDRTTRAEDTDLYDPTHIEASLDAVAALDARADVPVTLLIAPRTVDVASGDFGYPMAISDGLHEAILHAADGRIHNVDVWGTLRAMHESGDAVYYRTDHHWTTLGAYTAYRAILASWGMEDETLPADAFTVREIPDFYGTTWSRAGLYGVSPDTPEIWEVPDDDAYAVLDADGNVLIHGFIDERYLTTKDKYGAFLGGTHSLIRVECTENTDRPRLLVARDSFASTVIPFLARHFDIVAVNLSGGMTELSTYAAQYDCDRILILCNAENLVTSDALRRIN